jgi:hypothetical protein
MTRGFCNMSDLVECHSGFTYADRPVALIWEGRRLEILQVLAEWRVTEEKHFRVRAAGGRIFELAYSQATEQWQIQQP